MEWMIAVSFGEIFLKGKNRHIFYRTAIDNIKRNLRGIKYDEMYSESSKLYIKAGRKNFEKIKDNVLKVFGISYVSYVIKTNKNIEDIYEACKRSWIFKNTCL